MGWRRSKPLYASHSIRSFDATKVGLFTVTLFYKSLSLPFFPRPLLLPLLILSQCNSSRIPEKNVTILSTDHDIKFAGNWSSIPRKDLTVKTTDETNAQFTFVFDGSAVYYVSRITEKGGIVGIGVDSSIVQTSVDMSSGNGSNTRPNPKSKKPQVLFSATGLDQNVSHTLTVINHGTGQKGGKTVELGKLLVTQGENNTNPDANNNNSTTTGITSTLTSTSTSTTSIITTTTLIQISRVGSSSSSITSEPHSSSTSSGVLKSIGKPSLFAGSPSSHRDHIIPTVSSDTKQFHTGTASDDGGPTSSIGSDSENSAGATTSSLGIPAETTTSAAPTNSIASTPTTLASSFPPEIPTSQTTSLDASPSVQDSSGSSVPRSNIGKVAGIVIGVVLFLFLLLCCVMTILRMKNRRAMIAARRRANPYAFSGSSFCSPGEISNDVSNNVTDYPEIIHTGNQANEQASTMSGSGSNLRSSATIQISDLSNSSNFARILEMLEEQLGPDTVPNSQVADHTRERQYY